MTEAIIELQATEARDAKIAAQKEGMDRTHPALQELNRAFGDDDTPFGTMRFKASAEPLSEIAMKAQIHGKKRREKGHNGAQAKYYSIGDKIESQLVKQGEWVEVQ